MEKGVLRNVILPCGHVNKLVIDRKGDEGILNVLSAGTTIFVHLELNQLRKLGIDNELSLALVLGLGCLNRLRSLPRLRRRRHKQKRIKGRWCIGYRCWR